MIEKGIAKKEALNKIKKREDKIWEDIYRARTSFSIVDVFINKLTKKYYWHHYNRDLPLIDALWAAALDSVIISLGRLLNPNPEKNECTLSCYRNSVMKFLKEYGPVLNESEHAKNSLKRLNDMQFIKKLKIEQKKFTEQILPWRNKVTAHSQLNATIPFPHNLNEVISYVEEVHTICHSAMEDTGGPNIYLDNNFEKISEEWADCIIMRQKPLSGDQRVYDKLMKLYNKRKEEKGA